MTQQERGRRIGFRLAAMAFGVLAALLFSEVALRIAFPDYVPSAGVERSYFAEFDPELGWRPRTSMTALHQRYGFSVRVHQNQFGMRGPDTITKDNPSGKRRILILGDSYAWGFGVEDDQLFTSPKVHGTDVEFLNFGVSGYGTDQEYLLYQREGAAFAVDEVALVFTLYNDVANNLSSKAYNLGKPYYTLDHGQLVLHNDHVQFPRWRSVMRFVRRHGRVLNFAERGGRAVGNVVQQWLYDEFGFGFTRPRPVLLLEDAVTTWDRKGLKVTAAILDALNRQVTQQGRRFYVVFVPYKPHILDLVEHNHPYARMLAAELTARHVEYREPYFVFLEHARAGDALFNDLDNHFSPAGHALFAHAFVDPDMIDAITNLYTRVDTETSGPVLPTGDAHAAGSDPTQ